MKDSTPRFRTLASVALLLAVFSVQTFAQTPAAPSQPEGAKGLAHGTGESVRMLPDKAKRYALVIGVDEYVADTNISRLNGAANDARAIADALVKYAGFERDKVILLTTDQPDTARKPVRNVILGALKSLKNLVEKDGMLVVAFSGHGVERQRDKQVFLLPSDALSNPEDYDDSAISVARVKDLIKQTQASQVMLILDSCRNDPAAGKGTEDNKLTDSYIKAFDFDRRNSGIRAFVTLYAASEGQRAWEYKDKKQGYFSWAIVEALRGQAANDNGEVTLGGLIGFLQREVPKRAQWEGKKQDPFPVIEGFANELVLSVNEAAVRAKEEQRLAAERAKAAAAAVAAAASARPEPPKTGSLMVVSEPGAVVHLKPAGGAKGAADQQKTLPAAQRHGQFDQLQPARYVATATREGYAPAQAEVEVVAGRQAAVDLTLKPLLYSVKLRTNVAKGRVEFGIKGEPRQMVEFGGGQVTLANLQRGEYHIRVVPDDAAYLSQTNSLAVTSDAAVEYVLERRLRDRSFVADFSLAEQWGALPSGWRGAQVLEVKGAGAALLRDESVRFADLQLNAAVRLNNGAGVSLIIRAADEQNYYLVRVGGPKSDPANKLRLILVRQGRPQQLGTLALGHYKLDDGFQLSVKVTGNRFDFTIDDNTGRTEPGVVGVLFDDTRAFGAGTLGIAAEAGDHASVLQFYVCPNQCPKITGESTP